MKCATSVVVAFFIFANAFAVGTGTTMKANPIRRVVNMLAAMQQKVTEEGKVEEELFEKYMCYCKTGVTELEQSIQDAEVKLPQVKSALKEAVALKEQLGAEIKQHRADKTEAQEAIAKATSLRDKEAAQFAKDSAEMKTNIASMAKGIAAITKGLKGSFLQTKAASRLRKIVVDDDHMSNMDRDVLSAFLSEDDGEDYSASGNQIVGILEQMKATMESDLADMTKKEQDSQADFQELIKAKTKEIDTNQKALESKLGREGETGVEIETLKADIADTEKAYEEDKKFIAELGTGCKTKKVEYEEIVKTRNAELLAIGDTIKMLNDDDALELFKKTLPAPTLLQTSMQSHSRQKQALRALGKHAKKDPRLRMIAIALKGRSGGFEKVMAMIDKMVGLLGEEQKTDDDKKSYCEAELDKTEDALKVLMDNIKDLKAAIDDASGTIETIEKELAAGRQAMAELDIQVNDATSIRKKENAEYEEVVASNTAAKDLLNMAKNRLAKFYAPKLYKPPPGGAAALVQVKMHRAESDSNDEDDAAASAAPPPPPEAVGAYKKKTEAGTGVMAMMDLLIADIDKDLTEAKVEEDNSQKQYETFIAEAQEMRASSAKSMTEKSAAKADMEAKLEKMVLQKKGTTKEAAAKSEVLGDLHGECDWLLQNYGNRKTARDEEAESLKSAKAVLAGAKTQLLQVSGSSLMQTGTAHRLNLRGRAS